MKFRVRMKLSAATGTGGGLVFTDDLGQPLHAAQTFSWPVLGVAGAMVVLGEFLEFTAGTVGAKRGGASRRGMVGAFIGGVVGAILGAPFGLILGALAGGMVGTAIGAMVGELTRSGVTLNQTIKPATGAMAGRLFGTLGKLACGIVAWVVLTVAAFVP